MKFKPTPQSNAAGEVIPHVSTVKTRKTRVLLVVFLVVLIYFDLFCPRLQQHNDF